MLKFSHEESLLFSFDGDSNILNEKDFAIKNNRITAGIPYGSVLGVDGLWAPPYASSNLIFDIRLFGEKIKTQTYRWFPFAAERQGKINGLEISSLVTFAKDMRTLILNLSVINTNKYETTVPVQIKVQGGVDYIHHWEFSTAIGEKETDLTVEPNRLFKINNDKAILIASTIGLNWFSAASLWEGKVSIRAGQETEYRFAISLGAANEVIKESEFVMSNPEKVIADAVSGYEDEVQHIFANLPFLESDNKELVHYYYRSLVHYLTNKWTVDEFIINPYYSTGGMKGGCVGSYLWDFSGGWQIHAIYDPETDKNQIKQYLKLDLSKCFAFNPVDGSAFGPWYPVNHEKIIGLIFYYVNITGDIAFLNEEVNGKPVYEWVIWHALLKDDISKPIQLTDYGIDGEHHLELRRGIPYRGIMPDLNGRRYMNYIWAYELSKLAGCPCDVLPERAKQLKALLKERLWNKDAKWFEFISAGKRDTRYTVQMLKLFNSPVLDEEEEKGLLSHLNEEEFLSEFGLHSMSKLDAAYDQIDIDNGGGGACSLFAPVIAEKLYKAGKGEFADDILKRVLWWGERVPYWGDSFVANYMDYRQDTPLQCTIGGVAGAQCIIFGMFGVNACCNGTVSIKPHLPSFCNSITLKGLRIHGNTVDVSVKKESYSLVVNGKTIESKSGCTIYF